MLPSVQSSFCIPGRTEQLDSCAISKSHREQLGMVVPFLTLLVFHPKFFQLIQFHVPLIELSISVE